MKRKYIIDGNNLIHKIPSLCRMQKKAKQSSRVGLVFQLERYFHQKKIQVSLHFDGHQNEAIKGKGIKITYSESTNADNRIKDEISISDNPKLITVVTSDQNVADFARVNSCAIIKAEEFARVMNRIDNPEDEEKLSQSIDKNEMKKLFGIE